MTYEKDETWGVPAHHPLPRTRVMPVEADIPVDYETDLGFATPEYEPPGAAFGPEAHERAQNMAYERTRRIQQESPYVVTSELEHVVHDQRLYVGMWIIAGVGGVTSFLTFSLPCVLVTAIALLFALYCSPGRERRTPPGD